MPLPEQAQAMKQKREQHDAREKEIGGMRQHLQEFINACIELKENPSHSSANFNRGAKFGDFMDELDRYIEKKLR